MGALVIVLTVLQLLCALALVVVVLFQSGKDKRLSGTIAGGAETFFGKSKAADYNKTLSVATTIVSIVFAVLVLAMYLLF